jgi:hypothetical protein
MGLGNVGKMGQIGKIGKNGKMENFFVEAFYND